MKKITTFIVVTVTIIILTLAAYASEEIPMEENKFYILFDLDIFNRFNSDGTTPATDSFQRYHMLTFGSRLGDWDLQFVYDWYDKVISETSIHTITPWGIVIKRDLDPMQHLEFNYWWVTDLFGDDDTKVVRLEYCRQILLGDQWVGDFRVGGKIVNDDQFAPIFGGQLIYRDYYHLGLNFLSALDAHLMDEMDNELNLPLNIGLEYPLNENITLKIDFYKFLKKPSTGLDKWFVGGFEFILWD
ncbi:MAG: hypothetical protein KAX49_00340 [Halanaerobiales bacterium]|nr:hypothetical protein [Halanaerobiales bacterium]